MFDISFFELLMIAVVGLVVIGPDKLPGAIRTTGLWLGRIKRTIGETRREVERQLGADEIRRELHNEQVMRNLEKMRHVHKDLQDKVHRLERDANQSILAPDNHPQKNNKAPASDSADTPETAPTGVADQSASEPRSDTTAEANTEAPSSAEEPTPPETKS